mgnify:CR=1 FL=1
MKTVREFLDDYQESKRLEEIVIKTEYGIIFWGTVKEFNSMDIGTQRATLEGWKVANFCESCPGARVLIEVITREEKGMKTDAALKIMARTIERLKDEAGLLGIQYSAGLEKKLEIHCEGKALRRYIEKNDLEYNYKKKDYLGYETEDYILFEYIGKIRTYQD